LIVIPSMPSVGILSGCLPENLCASNEDRFGRRPEMFGNLADELRDTRPVGVIQ
jgi:hypothetical protein